MKTAAFFATAAALLVAVARAEDAPKGTDVQLTTADGLTIAATYWPPAAGTPEPAPAVVALPMYRQTRASYEPMVRPVTDRGMALLALDLRGHGGSAKQGDKDLAKNAADRDPALFNAMHLDAEAAIAWLAKEKKTPKGRIALLGASVGCSVAIDTAVRNPDEVGAVVCLTPGANYLGVPTMEHIAKWKSGLPLLLVSSDDEAKNGAGPIMTKLDGKGAELRIVKAPADPADPMSLHGTKMLGKVADVEDNAADWLAYHVAFHRIRLGDVELRVGSAGSSLYVGETEGGATPLTVTLRVGTGSVTDPWSASNMIGAGKRAKHADQPDAPMRLRTKISRERLGVEAGRPFAVAVSLDGRKFVPEAGEPPLLVVLR